MCYIRNNPKFVKKIFNLDSYFDTVASEREGHSIQGPCSGRRELNEHVHNLIYLSG